MHEGIHIRAFVAISSHIIMRFHLAAIQGIFSV